MTTQDNSNLTLDSYTDQLFFGVLSLNPHPSIEMFARKYVPVFYKETDRTRTDHPQEYKTPPSFITVTNTYIFEKHPFFNGKFSSGQLAITQKTYSDPEWLDNISEISLCFEFSDEIAAAVAFKLLVETYSEFDSLKKITVDGGIEKAEFTDVNSKTYYGRVQIILAKNFFAITNVLLPESGETQQLIGYKIQLKIGNNLY
ncbi:hypothetical protein QTN47_06250 [Danxiaibacter flavus]|uniref:Uncharacterized protein n=1 Tax=Danxiaibacter flavus TaxID=3049108 RepID=A0ABV3ZB46_9BACT|nr:hypothetical protein QNM32_06250 [Chitinophagaceae bacterium DXS]